jgi:hypothetical protein
MQRHIFCHFALGDEASNPRAARFSHLLANLQLFLGQPQNVRLRSSELRCDGHLLNSSKRDGVELLLDRLDMGGWRGA